MTSTFFKKHIILWVVILWILLRACLINYALSNEISKYSNHRSHDLQKQPIAYLHDNIVKPAIQ